MTTTENIYATPLKMLKMREADHRASEKVAYDEITSLQKQIDRERIRLENHQKRADEYGAMINVLESLKLFKE